MCIIRGRTHLLLTVLIVIMQGGEVHGDDGGVLPHPARGGHDDLIEVEEEEAHEVEGYEGLEGEGAEVEGENEVGDEPMEEVRPSPILLQQQAERSVAEEEALHLRAMQMEWAEAFEAEVLVMRTDRTACVSGSISQLAERLQRPIFEGSPILLGDYCVSQLHVREVIIL